MSEAITIKSIRTATGLSQRKFAEKYGIPRRTIEDWESGARHCPDYVIRLLAQVALTDSPQRDTIPLSPSEDGVD